MNVNYTFQDINCNLINKINFSNKTFITRLEKEEDLIKDEELLNLITSIKKIGILNPIYLLEKNGEYIIIAGYLRALALKEIFKENVEIPFPQKAIIYNSITIENSLQVISIEENLKRKSPSILELSYKFHQISEIEGYTIEECLKKFQIGKTQFHAIKKALDFHPFIKEFILEKVGPVKADILNKILDILLTSESEDFAKTKIKSYINIPYLELKNILKSLQNKSNTEDDMFEFKKNGNIVTFKIKHDISTEDYIKIQTFIKTLLKH